MAAAMNGTQAGLPPSNTLYCSNLPDKLPKEDLRRALYMLFTTYGPVLDVVALKTAKMRGQAHVLFRDREASAAAMRALQDFEFFGKPMKIKYAKSKSDTLAKLDGTYKQPQPTTESKTQATSVQQSVFAGPPGTTAATSAPDANGKTVTNGSAKTNASAGKAEEEEVPMEEDDAPMEMSDDDD